MALVVIRAGVSTTVQDRGRPGYRSLGVPVAGAFDRASLDLANALLGNDTEAAALEMTLVGGIYRAETRLAIALAGSPMSALIREPSGSERPIRMPQSATLQAGEELSLGGSPYGARCYLAVQGGWKTLPILGSRSSEIRLKFGEILYADPGSIRTRRPVAWPWSPSASFDPIRIVDGPDSYSQDSRLLEAGEYRITHQADRMGLNLEGPTIDRVALADRPSAPVAPGAVQITNGQPIILGVAGGTMGGYLHLAHVITADLDRLGQLRPSDPVRFRRVEIDEARRIDRLDQLKRGRLLTLIRASVG